MLTGPKRTITRARKLRSDMSLPEVLLWRELRGHPEGVKFRRQHPAGPFVLDFYCAAARLAVEVDGEAHNRAARTEADARRDAWLEEQGVFVLRIPAHELLNNLEGVVTHIVQTAKSRRPLHHPSGGPPPRAGEE